MTTAIPLCIECRWYKPDTGVTCDAFPGGIPEKIIMAEIDHTRPMFGQKNKIVYKKTRKKLSHGKWVGKD